MAGFSDPRPSPGLSRSSANAPSTSVNFAEELAASGHLPAIPCMLRTRTPPAEFSFAGDVIPAFEVRALRQRVAGLADGCGH